MNQTNHSARILIVDDHPNTAAMLARVLQKIALDINVLTARSGEEALEKAGDQAVDVLITDFMMPGMNGLELIERFSGELKPAHTILMTAYDTPGLAISARRLGVQDYMVKPVQPDRIQEIVLNTLRELNVARSAVAAQKSDVARILIADDYPDNVRLLAVRLKAEGYDYITAADGEETLAKVRSEQPDLVLLDVDMPKKNGFQVLAEMRADPELACLPVIIVSAARIGPADVREGLTLGADDYVTKPVDWRELIARIRTKLRVKQAEDELRRKNKELSALPEISQGISLHLDLEDLVEQTLLRTMEALDASDAYAAIIQPDGKLFERAVHSKIQHKSENSAEHSLSVHVATTRKGIIISDAAVETQWDLPLNGKTRSLIAAPLLGRKDVIGVLTLTHERPGYFRPEHLVLLQAISSQAAMAIENAQLYNSEHKRVQELVALNLLSRQISSFTNSTTLLDTFPALMQSTLGYPMVTLWLNQSEKEPTIQLKLRSHASAADIELGDEDSLSLAPQQAATNNRAVLVSGLVSNSPAGKLKTGQLKLNSHTFRSVAAAPFLLHGNLAGVLAVHSPSPGQIQDSDRVVLETLASQVASALERIHLFESVNREQRRLAAVLDSAADAILMFDQDERLQITNPAGMRLFTDIDAAVGQPLPRGKGYDELIDMLKQAKEKESGLSGEASWPDGRTFMISIAPVKQEGWVVVLSDVSHFKALDKLKNEFIATASHDLKNPLTTVMGFSDLIGKAGPLNEMQSDFLKRIQQAAQHMHELVINLLEMARMEMGIELDLEDVDIGQLLTAIEDEFRPQAAMKGHQLVLDLAPDAQMVRGDLKRLQQVARNLVGNAIKYTPDGGVVTISTRVENGEVRMAIQDTGIGIPAEALPNLFQKFYRVRCEQTENIEGNGLGLAIVKSIVERHNGHITVSSTPGKGSTFTVSLPQILPV